MADGSAEPGPAALPESTPGGARQRDQVPLSPLQRQIWFLENFASPGSAYHIALAYRLTGVLDLAALQAAATEVIRRHESLRARFAEGWDGLWQIIEPAVDDKIRYHDLRHLPGAERETAAKDLLTEAARRRFDLAAGPLLRLEVVRLRPDSQLLAITAHHICVDGWAMTALVNELSAGYAAFVRGQPPQLPDPVQLPDVVSWQLELLQGARFDQDLDYWTQRLRGLEQLALPADRPRPREFSYRGSAVSLVLPAQLQTALQELAGAQDVTTLILVAAAFTAVLARYTGQDDIVIGTVASGRGAPRLRSVVGPLITLVVLRNDLSGDPSFTELLARTRATILGAWAHRNVPFEDVVTAVAAPRDASRNPLFQVVLQLLGTDQLPCPDLPGLAVEELDVGVGGSAFDLTLAVKETARELAFRAEFAADLFDAARMRRLLGHLEQVLQAVAADPGTRVSELPLTPGAGARLSVQVGTRQARR